MKNVTTAQGQSCERMRAARTVNVFAPEVDTMILARGTVGFSGADLQNLVK